MLVLTHGNHSHTAELITSEAFTAIVPRRNVQGIGMLGRRIESRR
jgi:hypothetical protein